MFDADGDGRQDVLFMSGISLPAGAPGQSSALRLFRNGGSGTFEDATAKAGLNLQIYAMGAAAGDFDNDGRQDLAVTGVGQSRLFRNAGDGRFVDVTDKAGLGNRTGFSTSALWIDYDRDGLLDLVICNYVRWTPQTDIFCSADGKTKSYCTPEAYPGATSWLYRNLGNGTFEDVTAKSGLLDTTSKALGVTMLDFDADGWPDLFVANDTQPNKLYRNRGNGTFQEVGVQAGLAFSEDGRARAGMGTDAADFDNSGVPSLVVTNFSGEMLGLYSPVRPGVYADRAPGSELGKASRLTLGFGCFFFDVDLDGLLDLLVVNGHIDDRVARTGQVNYAESPHLFHNRGKGQFVDVAREVGAGFAAPKVGRGAAFGDVDLDGDLDVLITTNGGPAAPLSQRQQPEPSQLPADPARRQVEPRCDRRQRARQGRSLGSDAHGPYRIELPLAVGASAHIRSGRRVAGRRSDHRVAERIEAAPHRPPRRPFLCGDRGHRNHSGERPRHVPALGSEIGRVQERSRGQKTARPNCRGGSSDPPDCVGRSSGPALIVITDRAPRSSKSSLVERQPPGFSAL